MLLLLLILKLLILWMLIDDDSKVDSLKFEILLLWQSASSLVLLLFSLDIISKSLFWLFDKIIIFIIINI